jgi:hypothetical protein
VSTPTGNAYLSFTFQSRSYDLGFVNIQQYDERPEYAEDGYTLNRYAITVSGTALIADGTSTYSELAAKVRDGTGQIDSFDLRIVSGGSQSLLAVSAPDALRGPLLHLTVTEVAGRRAAILTFTLSASLSRLSTSDNQTPDADYPIISHRWTQSFSLDAGGLVTRTVRGTLTVNLAANGAGTTPATDGTIAGVDGLVPWADIFRRAVIPAVDGTSIWRRSGQTFAINESGNQLTYEITDEQARTNLPNGAYEGNCDFTYERSRNNLAYATLRFSCDLAGEVQGDVRALIWAAVELATTRIPFDQAILDRLSVQEKDMMKRAAIRLEIDARCPATAIEGPTAIYAAVPLARLVGIAFTVSRSCSFTVGAYGGSGNGVHGVPHWVGNTLSAKPNGIQDVQVAAIVPVIESLCPLGTPATVLLVPDTDLASANALIVQGPFDNEQQAAFNSSGQTTTVEKAFTTTDVDTDTGMHRLPTMYTQGSDFVFQARKPRVFLTEVTTVRRTNSPPNRVFRPIPPGFVVVKDEWRVNHGEIDSAGQRSFTGIYTRKLMAFDGGGATSNGFSTVSSRRQWWVPGANPSVAAPLTLGYNLDNQVQSNNVLAFGLSAQSYPLGTAQNYA